MSRNHASPERRRSADRILDTAEGVLITLRYDLNRAFFELAQTAKRHGVTAVSLADALVALVQRQSTEDCEQRAVEVARDTWGPLVDRHNGMNHASLNPVLLEPDNADPTESI